MQQPKMIKIEHQSGTEWRVIKYRNNYDTETHHFIDEQEARQLWGELLTEYGIGGYEG